jgi:hypothetical protein
MMTRRYAQLVNDDLQNIHNTVVPNLEETISDEKKERLKLEIWGRTWNLVISGIEGCLEEKPRETENLSLVHSPSRIFLPFHD